MEGISSEAASLAAHQGLTSLLDLRLKPGDDRGRTGITFTEDVAARFIAYGWNVNRRRRQ